jgi:hypothetical protein
VPAFLFCDRFFRNDLVCEHRFRAILRHACNAVDQQTVDGVRRALEIRMRSSYVPGSPFGGRSGFGHARLNAASSARWEIPRWMK